MKIVKLVMLVAVISFIAGCGSMPPIDFTVKDVGVVPNRKDVELKSITVGFASQSQQKVVDTQYLYTTKFGDPMPIGQRRPIQSIWKESLEDAINRSLIFRDDVKTKVNLSVRIVEMDWSGLADIHMKTSAIYEVVNRANGDLLFTEVVESEGIVPAGYAFVGNVRLRESYNRAVRNNIANFINSLQAADFSKPRFKGSLEKR